MTKFDSASVRVLLPSSASRASGLINGERYRVEVVDAVPGGVRVRVGGQLLVSASLPSQSVGSSFVARVRLASVPDAPRGAQVVFLDPVSDRLQDRSGSGLGSAERLGIPNIPLSTFLVGFFKVLSLKLDQGRLLRLLEQAQRFPGRTTAAAEAAVLLE